MERWQQLPPLLCSDAATPLLLRLKTLLLPQRWETDNSDEAHDAFLCRLSSLPAPPALQHFSAVSHRTHRAGGLLSVFSLPHLTQLDLSGLLRQSELTVFSSSSISALAPLVSLVLPDLEPDPTVYNRDDAAAHANTEAMRKAVRLLLSRLTTLRRLSCDARAAGGVVALPNSRPGDGKSGCSASLYSLTVRAPSFPPPLRFPFTAPLSFPQLTELVVTVVMTNADMELLLPACPQLLMLDCRVQRSWSVVLLAARCCSRLLELTVRCETERVLRHESGRRSDRAASVAVPQLDGSSCFLPQLITLRLLASFDEPSPGFSVLSHFTSPPHAQLRHVRLAGRGLTAQRVLSLACLPRLSHCIAVPAGADSGIAEMEQARRQARQQLLRTRAAGDALHDLRWPTVLVSRAWSCSCCSSVSDPPLGPHQQQEMRRQVLDDAVINTWDKDDLLSCVEGVERDAARAVFFAELRSVLTLWRPRVADRAG